jgi:hypothetical protein
MRINLRLDDGVRQANLGRPRKREWPSIQEKISVSADGGRMNRLDLRALAR